jgi:hypothetical protein
MAGGIVQILQAKISQDQAEKYRPVLRSGRYEVAQENYLSVKRRFSLRGTATFFSVTYCGMPLR